MATALSSAAVAGSSAESEAFRKCSSDLLRGIQDPELLAWELYSDDVVSETVVDEVSVLGLSAVQRKTRLLSAVRNQIAVDPAKFQNLLLALKKQPPLINVAEKLETIFKTCAISQPQESAHTYNLGFPVELLREAWYHTGITRETAEERLEHATNGCFLVRESETKPGCFSLSLKHPEGIAHFPIERKDSGLYEVPGTHKGFTTLPDLVDYFTHHSISEDPHHLLGLACLKALSNSQAPNSPSPPPIPEREKHQQQNVPIPVPRKNHLATGKHTADINPKAKASPNDDQQSGNTSFPYAQDSKSLLLYPHSRLRWRRGADLPVAMSNHHIVRIGNNVYCGGGYTGNTFTSRQVFQYDPEQDKWTLLPICPTAHFGLTQLDGKLVTVGGRRLDHLIPINDVYVFEEFQTWEKSIPSLPTARVYPTAFSYKSALVVSGGVTHWNIDSVHSTRTTAVEVFQSKSSQWYRAEPLPFAHDSMSHAIINDTCYLIGGGIMGVSTKSAYCTSLPTLIETAVPPHRQEETNTTPQASPSSPTWQVLPQCPLYYSAAAELGGCLLAIGGMVDQMSPSSAVHVYSPSTNSWARMSSGDLAEPRYQAAATQLKTGEVIFVGGEDGGIKKFTLTVFIASIEH